MAATITVEEEHGTYTRTPRHPHNGYYAGDFRAARSTSTSQGSLTAFALRAAITSTVR